MGPLRLVAQDIGFSVREQGFDSPRGYFTPGSAGLFFCACTAHLIANKGFASFYALAAPGQFCRWANCVAHLWVDYGAFVRIIWV